MTYWTIRWQSATGAVHDGPGIGRFTDRRDAEVAMLSQVRAAADALEHGTGKPGVATSDGSLYCDDWGERYLGRYIIEKIDPQST